MLNSIGLENVGVEGFERDKLPYLRQCGTRVLVNFFGATFDEYVACGAGARPPRRRRRAGDERLVPEHQGGRHRVRHRSARAGAIWCAPAARSIKKPLWIKLTPNTSDIVALARACADGGADGLSIINTITGMAIDARTRRPEDRDDLRRPVGPGHQADRAAHGLPGPPRGRAAADLGHRRHPGRDRRDRILPGRRHARCRSARRASSTRTPPGTSCATCRRACAADGISDVRELIGALARLTEPSRGAIVGFRA